MPANLILFDKTKDVPRMAARALQLIREGRQLLSDTRAAMLQARDANAAAKASFDELDSLHAKLTTDASVSAVATAISQACAKHGL